MIDRRKTGSHRLTQRAFLPLAGATHHASVPRMRRSRIAAFAVAALVAVGTGFGARAQDASDGVEAARAYTRKGLSLYELGKYAQALEALEAAYEKKRVPALLFNIAQCHRQLGHLEQAARLYRSFLRTDPPEAGARQARDLLAKVEDALKKQAAAVQSPPHGLTDASGKAPEPPAWTKPAEPPPPPPRTHQRWPAIAAGGVAAGAAGLGVLWALDSRSTTNQLAQLHQAGPVDPARDASLRNDASSKYTRSKICYAAAAVTAAAGVVFFFAF